MDINVLVEFVADRWDVYSIQIVNLFYGKIELDELTLFEFIEIEIIIKDTLFTDN
jgi:hypothetical protein